MSAQRLAQISGFSIDRVAAAAGSDPDVLRLENLDTDIPPPADAIAASLPAIAIGLGQSGTLNGMPAATMAGLLLLVGLYAASSPLSPSPSQFIASPQTIGSR